MAQPRPQMVAQLRVTQLWRDEVMDEKIAPTGIVTIGHAPGCHFITPDVGLRECHQLFTLTEAGLVLNLHHAMSGTLVLGGRQQRIEEALGAGTKERSVLVNPNDTGMIELGGGEHRFFFQLGPPVPTIAWDLPADFSAVMGGFGYSAFLHVCAIILIILFWAPDRGGRKGVLATLLGPGNNPKPPVEEVVEIKEDEEVVGTDDGEEDAPPASTAGEAGKSGGEGDRPRARTEEPPAGDPTVQKVLNRGILKHRDKLAAFGDNKLDKRLNTAMARMKGVNMDGGLGFGGGKGTGVGAGEGTGTLLRGGNGGPGGGGTAHADIVTSDRINTGGVRAPKGVSGGKGVKEATVSVQAGTPEGEFGDLTAEQILKVVRAHQGAVKYCYEKELQRIPGLAGKIVLNWTIDATGTVTSSKVGSSTMNNANVEDCLTRQVKKWKFPAPSGGKLAKVRFPFVFNGR